MDAIYARQSVEKADSLSIQGQIDLCCREAGEEYRVYQDRGYSGKNTHRPAFQHLIDDVEKGAVQKIIVYRLDRFSRSIADFGRLWEILKQHKVEFVSITESFDTTTPMGRAMLHIIMVFAQLERETTAERVRDNYYQRVKLGSWPGGPAPYGFSIGKLPDADGRLAPGLIPNEYAAVVEQIFDAYAQTDATLGSVARSLNAQKISGPKRAAWDNVTLSRILHSPLYVMADESVYLYYQGKGLVCSNFIEDFDGLHAGMIVGKRNRSAGKYQDLKEQRFSLASHCGLISSDMWLSCQYKLDGNRKLGGSGRGKHTWLSGLLKCACCGYSIKVNRDKDKYYLVCSGRSNLGLCDASIHINIRELESAVETELSRLFALCPSVDMLEDVQGETTQALRNIDQKIERLIAAIAEGSELTVPYINRAIQKLEEERKGLLEQQARSRHRVQSREERIRFSALGLEEKNRLPLSLSRRFGWRGIRLKLFGKYELRPRGGSELICCTV